MRHPFPRRLAAVAVAAAAALALSACTTATTDPTADGDDIPQIAVVLGGLANDGGFNQVVSDAANALADEGRVEVQLRESVTNAADAEPILRQYADEGYDLVIGWGLDFSESVFKVAEEYPDTDFVATGANTILEQATDNVETWTYDFGQFGYLTGWVLGKAQLSPWGIVDAVLAPYNEPAYDAARIAVKETNPSAVELDPIFTGSFSDTQLANQATRAQADLGAKIVLTAAYENNAGIIAAAKDAGIAVIGASNQSSADAATVNLGVVKLDWTPVLTEIVDRIEAGEFGHKGYSSEIANGGIVFGDFNQVAAAPAFPADIKEQVAELARQLADGEVTLPDLSQ